MRLTISHIGQRNTATHTAFYNSWSDTLPGLSQSHSLSQAVQMRSAQVWPSSKVPYLVLDLGYSSATARLQLGYSSATARLQLHFAYS